ncbi:MAG TPA: hypothetical protein VMT03_11285 [Polyangia bacterium]|nr:hypothetical protein [Polyangia bacterium]
MASHRFEHSRYAPELLARVAAGWRRLADDERRAVARAAHLAADLAALQAPPALLAAAARLIADEVRHLDVCATVAETIDPSVPVRNRAMTGARRLDLVPRAPVGETGVLRTLLADYAITKPSSAAALADARAACREPLIAWGYGEMLRDEARHATFGANAAAWIIRRWPAHARRALWTECLALSSRAAARARDGQAEALGLLPAPIGHTLPSWILPHLQPLGVIPHPANESALVH